MNIAQPFIRRPVGTSLMALALLLVGILAWRLLPVSPLPQVDFPSIVVNASLPGSSPESMAATVATPLERALGSIDGITALTSSSAQGTTRINLQFELGRDIHDAARDVQAAINTVRNQLPSGMPGLPTYRKINPSQAPIMALAVSSPNLSQGQIYDVASTILAQKIAQISGVGEVSLGGASLPAVRVQLNPGMLAHYGIALDEVRTAIAQTNPTRPLGLVEEGERRWQITISEPLRQAADYAPLIIRWQDGAAVRLQDVASVTDSVENRYRSGFHNDQTAVIMTVSRQSGANIVETIDAINERLPELRALLPADASLTVVMDRSPGIRATLKEAQLTLLLSSALVVLVVFLFLGSVRTALIPSIAIPVSLIGACAIIYLYGFSLNNLSLMALIVAAGLVVDDAIVVLENIQRHIEGGLSPYRAALGGAQEVNFTLLAMNFSLVLVFLSILFMGGLIQRLFREFSITLVAAVLISLLLSVTLTPAMCAHLLRRRVERQAGWLTRATGRLFADVRSLYADSLAWTLRHGVVVLLMLGAVIGLNIYLYISIPKGLLPQQSTSQIRGFVRGDDGFSFQVMQPKIEAYRRLLLADPAVSDVAGTSGDNGGVSNASLTVQLKPLTERGGLSAQQVINRIRRNVPPVPGGLLILYADQDIRLGFSFNQSDSELVLMADDIALLQRWAQRASEAMQSMPELVDVSAEGDKGTQQVILDIDREAARRLGINMQTITGILGNSFSQRQVATLYDDQNQYRVVMELMPGYTARPTVLDQLQAITADGARVPLSSFSSYHYGLADDRIYHDSQFAAASIGYSLAPGVTTQQAQEAIDRMLAEILLPTEVQARTGGRSRGFQESVQAQPLLIAGVLLAVYLLLGVLYESTLHPLTILSTLPSAGIGALLALRGSNMEFTLIALLGLFLLIGIVMKNAILMVDFALERQRRDGDSPFEAIHHAALLRLRPILMTNLAGLLGAVPLAAGLGEGAEMRQPLGIAIIGGLAVSQLLTLYTTPVVYLYFERLRQWSLRRFARTGFAS
ncbi:efflux RND transporter permease subunit [Oceanibaculum indicum]|uniref:Multidrug efflux pump n=1 Tax=Oceanibaculum indicum TaxID=526216 RepID=A0A420WPU9_9PROT|nr:efflux RND transporter permease subunit [Oceanibaculum indicum]RKQ73057.1 multidrug efflux pump [Oceanibaculum indicum]